MKVQKRTPSNCFLVRIKNNLVVPQTLPDRGSSSRLCPSTIARAWATALGCEVVFQPERSISKTRNMGAKSAKGDFLLFLDADTKITKKLITQALRCIDNGYKVISAISTFDRYHTITSYGVWFYNILSYIFKLGTGQFILINNNDFNNVNGFDEKIYGFEDFYFFKHAKTKLGSNKVKVLFTPVITSGRKFMPNKDQYTFIFQLLGVLLKKPIGKSKKHFEFWYGKQANSKDSYKKYIFAIVALMLFVENYFGSSLGVINEYKNFTTSLLFLGMLSLIFDLKSFLIISIITLIVEVIGETTGIPFGSYNYSDYYSDVSLLGVPIFIPIAWYILITTNTKLFTNPFKIGLSIVFIDLFLEKFADLNNIWKWNDPYLFTSPISNYISWFVLTLILYRFVDSKKVSLFYSTGILLMLSSYIGVNLMTNGIWFGVLLVLYALFIFGYAVNKKISTYY